MEQDNSSLDRILAQLEDMRQEIALQREVIDEQKSRLSRLGAPAYSQQSNSIKNITAFPSRRKMLARMAAAIIGGTAVVGGALSLTSTTEAKIIANYKNTIGTVATPLGSTVTDQYLSGVTGGLIGMDSSGDIFPFYLPTPFGVGGLAYGTNGIGLVGISQVLNSSSTITQGGVRRGIVGYASGTGAVGVAGVASGTNSKAIYGDGHYTTYAGYFDGLVQVVGTLNATTKNFKIDHPLDPANKFLYHSSIESSELKNLYDGIAILDDKGEVDITLPAWFEALNTDFRYQLTCIGEASPIYIAQTIKAGTFRIAGGKAGQQVCWQVTGVRQDAYAMKNPLEVEVVKSGDEHGKYLFPELFNAPEASKIGGSNTKQVNK